MNKLELKHIVEYLPYNLKCYTDNVIHFNNGSFIMKNSVYTLTIGNLSDINDHYKIESIIKPILRPISDLTERITNRYGTFVPVEKLYSILNPLKPPVKLDKATKSKERTLYHFTDKLHGEYACLYLHNNPEFYRLFIVNYLYKWHFDIHGLIDKGLAIDINTLK